MTRDELMAEIDRRWHLVDDLVADADLEHLSRVAGGPEAPPQGWTVGEVLLHMASWKRKALDVARLLENDPDAPDEEVNKLLFSDWRRYNKGHRDRSRGVQSDAILTEHRAAHAELVAALAALPERCLLSAGTPRGWLRPLMAHTFDHLDPDLRPALGKSVGHQSRRLDDSGT